MNGQLYWAVVLGLATVKTVDAVITTMLYRIKRKKLDTALENMFAKFEQDIEKSKQKHPAGKGRSTLKSVPEEV